MIKNGLLLFAYAVSSRTTAVLLVMEICSVMLSHAVVRPSMLSYTVTRPRLMTVKSSTHPEKDLLLGFSELLIHLCLFSLLAFLSL